MYDEINCKLEEAQQGIFRLKKIDTMLENLQKEKLSLEKKVSEQKDNLEKEDIDVEKLENKSLAHIFHSVLGNLEERIEKERQEALAAKLKYNQGILDLEDVNYQISKLISERVNYNACEYEYNRLYAEKKELLMKADEKTAKRILDSSEKLNNSNNNRKEIEEALSAGRSVISCVDRALKSLDSAAGWGTWDLLGGGLLSDLAKHSHIDDAKGEAEQTQVLLRQFRSELADIKITEDIRIETDGFAKFADFFFDGLIADWCMQSKIHNSQESVTRVKNQVFGVINKLNQLEKQEVLNIESIQNEINELILRG